MEHLGLDNHEVAETLEDIRQRDQDRFDLEIAGGIYAGVGVLYGNAPVPAPLFPARTQKDEGEAKVDEGT